MRIVSFTYSSSGSAGGSLDVENIVGRNRCAIVVLKLREKYKKMLTAK